MPGPVTTVIIGIAAKDGLMAVAISITIPVLRSGTVGSIGSMVAGQVCSYARNARNNLGLSGKPYDMRTSRS
jgi:hypothetical protein